jgi:hypothetical protein
MNIEIKNRFTGNTIIAGEYSSIKEALEENSTVDFTGARLSGIDLAGTNLTEINLTRADLAGANLFKSNLFDADLTWADLTGADLTGTNLIGTNLFGVNFCKTIGVKLPIISIFGSIHNFCYYNGEITIGCECHTVQYWIENYKTMGARHNYSPEQIDEYFGYIKMCEKYLWTQEEKNEC